MSTKVKKVAKPAAHPPYANMITAAIKGLKDKKGSSRQAILKYIVANNKVDAAKAGVRVKLALRKMVAAKKVVAAAAAGISAVPVSNPQLTRQDLLGKDLFGFGLDDGNELGHRFKRSPVFPLIKKPKPFLLPLPIPIPIG